MMECLRRSMPALSCVVLASCVHVAPAPMPTHAGEASYRLHDDAAATHYTLPEASTASGAGLLAHPAPVYPAALLPACPPPVELLAKLVVGTDGQVSAVHFSAASEADLAYRAAVREGVKGWRFEPLVFQRWTDGTDGGRHVVDSTVKPFSLDYVFRFACHDGKPQTGAAAS